MLCEVAEERGGYQRQMAKYLPNNANLNLKILFGTFLLRGDFCFTRVTVFPLCWSFNLSGETGRKFSPGPGSSGCNPISEG
jgi:hypothetical protein